MPAQLQPIAQAAALAQGSYALFTTPEAALAAVMQVGSGDFADSEARRLLDGAGIDLRHHQPNDSTGFSATVFFDRSTNKYVLGIRGTEEAADVAEDILRIGVQGFAGDQLVSLYRYYKKLTTAAGQAVRYSDSEISMLQFIRLGIPTNAVLLFSNVSRSAKLRQELALDVGLTPTPGSGASVIPMGAPLVVTGHSLGGHLALLFGRFFPEVTEHVYTYNAPGISPVGELTLRAMGIPPSPPSLVTNVSAVMGNEAISKIWSKPGETIGIATEPGSLVHQHSIVPLTDTLALYGAFGTLSPNVSAAMVSGIISAASPFPEDGIELLLDDLGALLGTDSGPTMIARTGADRVEREDYYRNLYAVLDSREAGRDYQIVSLVGKTALEMSSMSATDMSVRFALQNLSPFAARNADFSEFDGSVFSGMWIASRSEMLEAMLANNVIDRPYGTTGSSDSIVYRDVDLGVSFAKLSDAQLQVALPLASASSTRTALLNYLSDATYGRSVVFGSDSEAEGDHLVGLAMGDRLFGGAGADVLDGQSGDDMLDGGQGADVLKGGEGDDVLDGGAGPDRLEGGPGQDTYLYGSALDSDTIVDRDGAIYAGTARLTGGIGGVDGEPYRSSDGQFSYEFTGDLQAGGTLVVNGILRVEDFRNGDLGIRLVDGEIEVSEWAFETDAELLGDFLHGQVEISPGHFVIQDLFGNFLPISRISPAPDLDDNHLLYPGTPGNTHFIMGGGNDAVQDIYGGNDHIDLGAGDDVGFGGRGDDLIEGGPGLDIVVGGRGNDVLYAGSAATAEADLDDHAVGTRTDVGDVLSGGDGDDIIFGDAEINLIEGGIGDDRIFGGAGDDLIGGDLSNLASLERYQIDVSYHEYFIDRFGDFLWRGEDPPRFFQHSGDSLIDGVRFWENLLVEGPADGADWIDAGAGNDRVYAGGGDDFVLGGAGDDFINLGTGVHVAFGGDGNDWISSIGGSSGSQGDYLDGGRGDDLLISGDADDVLIGGDGNDQLSSAGGSDLLLGGAGSDMLVANGNAVLDGGSGDDFLAAGNIAGRGGRFRFGHGYGADVAIGVGTMTVEAVDVTPGEVAISVSEQNIVPPGSASLGIFPGMRIDIGGGGDSLFFMGWNQVTEYIERRIEFSDGTVWDDAYIQSLLDAPGPAEERPSVIEGSSAGDLIYGTAGPETLSGGLGDDWLIGGAGDDTYQYAHGDGFDRIEDLDATPGNTDILQFAEGIDADNVGVFAIENDYVLETDNGGVRLMGGRTAEGAIERIDFADGTRWTLADLEARAEVLPANRAPVMPGTFGSVSTDPGSRVEFALPDNAVFDPDRFDAVSLYAITADGERLPEWLQFDAASRTLAGTPGQGDAGVHELLFIAADKSGAAAAGSFTIQVGQIAPVPEPAAPVVEVFAESPPSTPQQPPAVEPVGAEPPVAPALPAAAPRENVFAAAATINAALESPRVLMDSTEPGFRDIQHRLDVLVQTGRTNLGERYAEAIREFEERRLEREEAPHSPPPTEEEIEAWNGAMHSWHDRHQGFAETELGGGDGAWGMGWGLDGPGVGELEHQGLAMTGTIGLSSRLSGVASMPALTEGLRDLR